MKNIDNKRCCAGAITAASLLSLSLISLQPAFAVTGNVNIKLDQQVYKTGDTITAEVIVASDDGSQFLLQSNLVLSDDLSLSSVSGDNISYNDGKIVGTAPQSQFKINIIMTSDTIGIHSIKLESTKLGAVDGTQNQTIKESEHKINVENKKTETPKDETVEETLPPAEPVQKYEKWLATVVVDNTLNVREGPGFNYKITSYLTSGAQVTVTEEETVSGVTWVHIETGWCSKEYLREGHTTTPEIVDKDDSAIEEEMKNNIQQEADKTEQENQSSNENALKNDQDKKDEYDKAEQERFEAESFHPAEPIEDIEETIPETTESPEEVVDIEEEEPEQTYVPATLKLCDSDEYMEYTAPNMKTPFYLFIESYNATFPDGYDKIAQSMGHLAFTVGIPSDISQRTNNVFLVYGNTAPNLEPEFFLFDRDSNTFFAYDKVQSKTVIVTEKPITPVKNKWLLTLLGFLSLGSTFAVGVALTSAKFIKIIKRGGSNVQETIASNKNYSVKEQEMFDMNEEEFNKLMEEYGPQIKKASDLNASQEPNAGDIKDVAWLAESEIIPEEVTDQETSSEETDTDNQPESTEVIESEEIDEETENVSDEDSDNSADSVEVIVENIEYTSEESVDESPVEDVQEPQNEDASEEDVQEIIESDEESCEDMATSKKSPFKKVQFDDSIKQVIEELIFEQKEEVVAPFVNNLESLKFPQFPQSTEVEMKDFKEKFAELSEAMQGVSPIGTPSVDIPTLNQMEFEEETPFVDLDFSDVAKEAHELPDVDLQFEEENNTPE